MGDQEVVEAAMAAEMPRCYHGGGSDDHAWMIIEKVHSYPGMPAIVLEVVGCRDCPAEMRLTNLLESYLTHQRLVSTGIAVITGELEQYREDFAKAAGGLGVPVDEMPPGSTLRRAVIANKLIRDERDTLISHKHEAVGLRKLLLEVRGMLEDGSTRPEIAAKLEGAVTLTK